MGKTNAELKKQQKPGTAPERFLNAERTKIVLRERGWEGECGTKKTAEARNSPRTIFERRADKNCSKREGLGGRMRN